MSTAYELPEVREPRKKRIAVIGLLLLLLVGVPWGCWKRQFPFGYSHCCDKGLHGLLWNYAEAHNGEFPKGEATPEASLTLLQRYFTNDDIDFAELLRGKSVPKSVTADVISRNELLGPESCGWHYVEGLRKDDDPRLALFWPKESLSHFGQRLSEGGHIVTFVNGSHDHITESQWPEFLEEQQRLLSERDRSGKQVPK